MPSIRILTRLSVVSLLGIQLFIETIAYPILEKDKDIKSIKPRLFTSGGKSKPLLGGALIGGGGILAYNHFKGSGNNAGAIIPSEPLSSSNGGPTASPFLSDTESQGSTDLATGAATGTGALPGTELGTGVANGAGTTAGTVPGTVPGAGAGVGTGTSLFKKDIIRRGGNGVIVPDSSWKGSVVQSSLGSIATVVVGSAVTNLFSGIVSGRKDRKAQQAANREAAGGELQAEPDKNTPNKANAEPLNTYVNESTYPSYSELKARARRPVEEYQTE